MDDLDQNKNEQEENPEQEPEYKIPEQEPEYGPSGQEPDYLPYKPEYEGNIKPVISPVAAGFIGLAGAFVLYQIVGGILTILIFGFDFEFKNTPVNSVRLMTVAGQILFILLPALLFSKWFYGDVSSILRIKMPRFAEVGLFILGILILTPLLQTYLYIQNYFFIKLAQRSEFVNTLKELFDSLNEMVEGAYGSLLQVYSFPEALFVVIVIAVVPAVCEEAMFRGFIQKSFELKLKPYIGALITALFFGLYHFNPYGILPLIVLGLFFGFAAYKSGSILVPIILHFINNFVAVMAYFTMGDEEFINSSSTGDIDLQMSINFFFIFLIMFSGLLFIIKKYYLKRIS